MSQLNGKGPEEKGSKTGRGLGNCKRNNMNKENLHLLGQGMGKRRKAGLKEPKD